MRTSRQRPHLRELLRALLACALLVTCYYLLPIEPAGTGAWRWMRLVLLTVGVAMLALLIGRATSRLARGRPGSRPAGLLIALFAGLVLSALIDYQVANWLPGEFAGLQTRTDALYFAVTTLATVGYGDVHAAGQIGRAVVIGQQLFNLAVLATGGSVLVNHLNRQRDRADQ